MLLPTFRRLQVFVAIVETGSFAAAARRLGIAQPSVSAHVQSLEAECATALFERRRGREPMLTGRGQQFLAHARELLADASRLEEGFAPKVAGRDNTLNIICQRSLAHSVLRETLTGFARANRDIRTSVRIGFQEEVLAGIRSGEADVGILLGDDVVESMPRRQIGRQRCVIYAAPGHALAQRRRIPPAEVARHDFVGPPARSLFGRTIAKLLEAAGVAPLRVVAETTEFGMSREFTAAGLGLCCSLMASVSGDLAGGRVVALDVDAPPLYVDVLQVTHSKRTEAYAVRQFTKFVTDAGAAWS